MLIYIQDAFTLASAYTDTVIIIIIHMFTVTMYTLTLT